MPNTSIALSDWTSVFIINLKVVIIIIIEKIIKVIYNHSCKNRKQKLEELSVIRDCNVDSTSKDKYI